MRSNKSPQEARQRTSRVLSALVTMSMVLSLLPSQGVAEMRDQMLSAQEEAAQANASSVDSTSAPSAPSTSVPAEPAQAAQSDATAPAADPEPAPEPAPAADSPQPAENTGSASGQEGSSAYDQPASDSSASTPATTADSSQSTAPAATSDTGSSAAVPSSSSSAPAQGSTSSSSPAPSSASTSAQAPASDTVPTSANFRDFDVQAKLKGVAATEGKLAVTAGKEYTLVLTFQERAKLQFADAEELVYALPSGFTTSAAQPAASKILVRYADASGDHELTLPESLWRVDGSSIRLTLNQKSDEYQAFAKLDAAQIEVEIAGSIAADAKRLELGSHGKDTKQEEATTLELAVTPAAEKKDAAASSSASGSQSAATAGAKEGVTQSEASSATSATSAATPATPKATDSFKHEDNDLIVTAKLEDASALPAGTELVVKRMTTGQEAYLAALNKGGDGSYTSDNTLLYDVSFVKDGKEVEPEKGSVSVGFRFKQNQLKDGLGATSATEIEVNHLPKENGKLTAEKIDAMVSVAFEVAAFETASFSGFAFTKLATTPDQAPAAAGSLATTDEAPKTLQTETTNTDDLSKLVTGVSISAPTDENGKYKMVEGETYNISMSFGENDDFQLKDDSTPMYYTIPTGFDVATTTGTTPTFNIKVTDSDGKVYTITGNTYQIVEEGGSKKLKVVLNSSHGDFTHLTASSNARFSVSFSGDYDGKTTYIDFGGGKTVDIIKDDSSSVSASKTAQFNLADKKVYYTVTVTSTGKSTNVRIKDTISDTAGALTLNSGSLKYKSSIDNNATEHTVPNTAVNGNSFDYTIASMKNGEVITFTYNADIDINDPELKQAAENGTWIVGTNKVQVSNEKNPTPVEREVKTNIDYSPKVYKSGMTLDEDGETFHCTYVFNSDMVMGVPNAQLTDTLGNYLTLDGISNVTITKEISNGTTTTKTVAFGSTDATVGGVTKAADNKSFTFTTPNDTTPAKYTIKYDVKVTGTSGVDSQITVDNTVNYKNKESKGTGVWTPPEGSEFKLYKTVDNIDYGTSESGDETVDWTVTINVPKDGLSNAEAVLEDTLPGGVWIANHDTAQYDSLATLTGTTGGTVSTNGVRYAVTVAGLKGNDTYDLVVNDTNHTATVNFYKGGDKTNPGLTGQEGGHIVTVKFTTKVNPDWLAAAATSSYLEGHTNTVKMHGKTASATAMVTGVRVDKKAEVAGERTVNGVKLPVYKYTLQLKNATAADNEIKDLFDRSLLEPLYIPRSTSKDGFSSQHFDWYAVSLTDWHAGEQAVTFQDYIGQDDKGNPEQGIKIITNAASMPTEPSSPTGYPPTVQITYYLTVKDEAALKRIQSLAVASGGTYSIDNTAKWGTSTDGGEVSYKYQGITKEMLTNVDDLTKSDEDIYADFRVTLNPAAAVINGGSPYEATDTVQNLSIVLPSIQITGVEESDKVTYDMSGDNLIIKNVPDGKKVVITYKARVKFDSIGKSGDTVDVNFRNDVSTDNYSDFVANTAHRKNTGEGLAENFAVNLMKYETDNMDKKLNGAVFKLYNAREATQEDIAAATKDTDPAKAIGYVLDETSPVTNSDGEEVTFETATMYELSDARLVSQSTYDALTDAEKQGAKQVDGMLVVQGDQHNDGWSIHTDRYYFLREIQAPEDHKLLGYDTAFKVSADGTTNYDKYIYHSGDTMSAKNTPGTFLHVEKDWASGYTPATGDNVVVKLQQRFLTKTDEGWESPTENTGWSDTILDADGVKYVVDAEGTTSNTAPTGGVTLTLNADNSWKGDFQDLPVYVEKSGSEVKVEYQIKEIKINGADADTTVETNAKNGTNNSFRWSYFTQGRTTVVTNTPEQGSLRLTKLVKLNGADTTGTLADGTYDFVLAGKTGTTTEDISKNISITIENGKIAGASIDYTDPDISGYTEGEEPEPIYKESSQRVAALGYVEVTDLAAGTYTITEQTDDFAQKGLELSAVTLNGETKANGVEVTVQAGSTGAEAALVSFTNNKKLGGLRITKTVKENGSETLSARALSKLAGTYNFAVYTDSACKTLAKDNEGSECTGSITVNDSGNATSTLDFENLVPGTYYVKETGSDNGMTLDTTVHEVTVEAGKTSSEKVENIINNYQTGALRIKKTVTVNGVPATKATATGSTTKADGDYTFQIFAPAYEGGTQIARVRLTFENGQVKSGKYEWIDERTQDAEGKNVLHWHESTDADSDLSIEYVDADDASYAVLRGLEPGSYEVHEHEGALPSGMTLVGGHNQGGNDQPVTVVAGQTTNIPTAAFTNNYEELGELELKKTLVTQSPIMAENVQFNFTVTMYKDAACTEVDTSIDGNYGDMTFHEGVATNIKLVGGEKKTAANLPTGRYFKITEGSAVGWSISGITVKKGSAAPADQTNAKAATGLITTTKSEVEFKNELDEGNLKVEKKVTSNFNSDKSKEFKFKVVLNGVALTGTYGEKNTDGTYKETAMQFTNGAAEFTLKDGQTKEAVKLPADISYTVTETTEDGFTTTWTGNTSDIIVKDQTKTVTATNTRQYGDLEIDKTVLPASHQASGDEFTFTVSLSDKSINGTFQTTQSTHKSVTFLNGVGQVKLKHGEKASVKDLPAGITYTVTESKAEGFTLSGVTGNTGKIVSQTTAKASFTNQYDNGGLVISKNVVSPTTADADLYFPFKVTLTLPAGGVATGISGKVTTGDDISYTNGIAYVFLKKGEVAVSNGIGVDYGYEVRELDISDESVKSEVQAHLPSSITIDQVATLANYSTVIQDGANRVLSTSGTIANGKISAATSSARYTNHHITGPLTVSKKLVSDSAADRNKEFTFVVTMYKGTTGTETDMSLNGIFGDMEFKNGVATVKVKGNGSITATGLPVGQRYKVEETSLPNNFTMTGITKNGTAVNGTTADGNITRDDSTIEFTNTRATGPLTLSKTLVSDRAADADQEFTFTVRLGDTSINKTYDVYKPATNSTKTGTVKFTQGVATLTLKGGESVKIDGLPTEVTYQVTEAGTPGFRLTGITQFVEGGEGKNITGSVAQGTITTTGDKVTYQNTRTPGELTVSKKLISDLPADADQEFTFTVEFDGLSNTAGNAQYDIAYTNPASTGKIQLSNGSATITLKGGQSATIKGLPTDVKYTVTETSVPDFQITGVTGNGTDVATDNVVNGKTGTIATDPATVEVTNSRMPGKLTVSKKLISERPADKDQSFSFAVKLYKDAELSQPESITKTYSGVAFTNGEATFTLRGGESKIIEGLPTGIYYKVTEANTAGFEFKGVTGTATAVSGQSAGSGSITTTPSTIEFTNERALGSLKFKKVVTGDTAPTNQEFTFTLTMAGMSSLSGTHYQGQTSDDAMKYIKVYDKNGTEKSGTTYAFKNGSVSVKLKADEYVEVNKLPLGNRFSVTETAVSGFSATAGAIADKVDGEGNAAPGKWYQTVKDGKLISTTYVGQVETTTADAAFATFTNKHEEGSLRIHKVVDSKYAPDNSQAYSFRVELSDKSVTPSIKSDKSDYNYEAGVGYHLVTSGDKVIPFNKGVATFTLTKDQYASITGLPAGTTYTVTETSYEGITTTWKDEVRSTENPNTETDVVSSEGKGTIVTDEVATTTATNTRELGRLAIAKSVVSHTPQDKTRDYSFKVTFYKSDPSVNGASVATDITGNNYGLYIYDADGIRVDVNGEPAFEADGTAIAGKTPKLVAITKGVSETFTLKDGWTAKLAEDTSTDPELYALPLGIYYKVEETPVDGMTTSTKLGQTTQDYGKIRATTTSTFTNMRIEGGLFVYKNVDSHIEGDDQKSFDFMVALYTDANCETLATNINNTYGSDERAMTFNGGIATFSLKSGEYAYAVNLPVGLYFKAVEGKLQTSDSQADPYPHFIPSTEAVSEGTGTSAVQVVTPLDAAGNITYTSGFASDGTPITSTFNYAAKAGGTGQIAANANRTVTVKNTRKAGNLKVAKAPLPTGTRNAPTDATFLFEVQLDDENINGTYGDMIFNKGKATFSLGYGQSASTAEYDPGDTNKEHPIGTLPVGMRYRVIERDPGGYYTTWSSTTWANDESATDPTTYTYAIDQEWTYEPYESQVEDVEGYGNYLEKSETRTISWEAGGATKTSVATNADFADPSYGEPSGITKSWVHADHATEWGWRETGSDGKPTGNVLVNGITVDAEGNPHEDVVSFDNKPQTGSLAIAKVVESPLDSDDTKMFHFHVQLLDVVEAGVYGQMYFDVNGVGYTVSNGAQGSEGFDLKHGDVVVAEGLPIGTRYQVTEDVDSDFTQSEANMNNKVGYGLSGELELINDDLRQEKFSNGKVDFRALSGFRNRHVNGELKVSKSVASDVESDKSKDYKFKISLSGDGATTYNTTYYQLVYDENELRYIIDENSKITFTNGVSSEFTLKDGEYVYLYKSDPSGDGWKAADGELVFVPCEYITYSEDGVEKQQLDIEGDEALPRGVNYTVTETDSQGLTSSWVGNTGTISGTTTAVADCTNTREGGNLTVSKELISEAAADKTKVFDFTVRLYTDAEHTDPLALTGRFGGMAFVNGVATVQIQGGNSVTATGLPHGTYYTVTEASATGFTLKGVTVKAGDNTDSAIREYESTTTDDEGKTTTKTEQGSEGQILSTTPSTVTFTNTRVPGVLRISKALHSVATADKDREFVFTVRLTDASINASAGDSTHGKVADTDKPLSFKNGIATVRLKGGEYASITNLPTDITYSVNEENAAGYQQDQRIYIDGELVDESKLDQDSVVRLADGMQIIDTEDKRVVTEDNTHELGKFTISKSFAPTDETGGDEKFKFEVQLYTTYVAEGDAANVPETGITTNPNASDDANPPEKFGDVVFDQGHATVELSKENNWTATVKNLPVGLYYTVKEVMTEDQQDNYRLVNSVGEIQAGQVTSAGTTASFTNERIYKGDLVIEKDVPKNLDQDRDQEFTLRVTLYNDYTKTTVAEDITKTYPVVHADDKPLEFKNGVATVKLRHWEHYDEDDNLVAERASAKNLPEGLAFEVEEIFDDKLQGFTPEITYSTRDEYRIPVENYPYVIIKNGRSSATVTNNRELVAAGIKKVWDDEVDQSMRPESLDVKLYRSDDAEKPYKELYTTVTLPIGDEWEWTHDMLPAKDYQGKPYVYTWKEDDIPGYTLTSTAYTNSEGEEQTDVTNVAGLITTLTNTRDEGLLKLTKTFVGPKLTMEQRAQIHYTIKDAAGNTVKELTLADFDETTVELAQSNADLVKQWYEQNKLTPPTIDDAEDSPIARHAATYEWTSAKLPTGTYTVTETNELSVGKDVRSYQVTASDGTKGDPTSESATPVVEKEGTDVQPVLVEVGDDITYSTLVIQKKLEKDELAQKYGNKKFNFTVTLTPPKGVDAIEGRYGELTFKDNVATVELAAGERAVALGLPMGTTYTVTEDDTGTLKLTGIEEVESDVKVDLAKRSATGTISTTDAKDHKLTFVNGEYEKPSFDKKIKDTNDSTGVTTGWQDSADYDIGDKVPYRLHAKLADDVTSYGEYYLTFTDQMETSLDYNKDAKVTVTGSDGVVMDPDSYQVTKVAENDHDFKLKITWTAGKDGATISDKRLNGAEVEVLFTATLNESANLGKVGNVNACKLTYSANPDEESPEHEAELPWDYVIAFTYQVDVSKVDQDAKPLTGAEFKLEKLIAAEGKGEGAYQEVTTLAAKDGDAKNVFSVKGLDDGTYRLTETKAPSGYKAIEPVVFEVKAEHTAEWKYQSNAAEKPVFDESGSAGSKRLEILSSLTGTADSGDLELAADEQLAKLAGSVANAKSGSLAVRLHATKRLTGRALKAGEFSFTLQQVDDNGKAVESFKAKTATNESAAAGKDANVGFGTIAYTQADVGKTYHYTIRELKGNVANVTYDTHVAKVDVAVALNDEGKLQATVTYDKKAPATFVNSYKSPTTAASRTSSSSSPRTGDPTSLLAIQVLAVAGAAAVGAGALRRRRRKEEQ